MKKPSAALSAKSSSITLSKKVSPRTLVIGALFVAGFALVGYRLFFSQAAVPLKPQMAGVIDRNSPPPSGYESVVNGWVVQANWADLQPTKGGPITTNNAIDQAITMARQKNMQLKLRIYAGVNAPEWTKNIGGAPFTISNERGQETHSGTVGRFWLPDYGTAYADFQSKLAAKYDAVSEIREVVIDRCSTIFAEPFIRENSLASNTQAYQAAGYTESQDIQCLREEVDSHQVWQQTRSSLDLTPFQPATGQGVDVSVSEQIADYCRQKLGARCVLGDNSLRTTEQGNGFQEIFAKIKAMGPPIYFQTATMDKIGSLTGALQKAIDYGAGMVELPAGYQNTSAQSLATYDQKLTAQAQTGYTVSTPPTNGQGGPGTPPPTSNKRHRNKGQTTNNENGCTTSGTSTICGKTSTGQNSSGQNDAIIQGSNGQPGQTSTSTSSSGNSQSQTVNQTVVSEGNTGQSSTVSSSSPNTPGVTNTTTVNSGGQNGSFGHKIVTVLTTPFRAIGRGLKHLFGR